MLLLLIVVEVSKLARCERVVRLLEDELVVAVRCESHELVPVVDHGPERLDTVRPLDALGAHTGEHVKHAMVLVHVLKVCIDLSNEAEWRATPLADELLIGDAWGDPGRFSSDLGGCELGLRNQSVLWLLAEA